MAATSEPDTLRRNPLAALYDDLPLVYPITITCLMCGADCFTRQKEPKAGLIFTAGAIPGVIIDTATLPFWVIGKAIRGTFLVLDKTK